VCVFACAREDVILYRCIIMWNLTVEQTLNGYCDDPIGICQIAQLYAYSQRHALSCCNICYVTRIAANSYAYAALRAITACSPFFLKSAI
jgi:hypothetical protein